MKKKNKTSSYKFLTANWEYLAMFNYEVDPSVLARHLPLYTEIDYFEGKALVSVVGFLFNDTKVAKIKWPGHVNFEEVNLRYYVRHFDGIKWKRGVGFVSEIVPKPLIAGMANFLYNEHYSTARMEHSVALDNDILSVEYKWKKKKQDWNSMNLKAGSQLKDIEEGSEAEFIFEHYCGYNKLNSHTTIEYAVAHPRWQVYPVITSSLQCDVEKLYGKEFVPFIIDKEPQSVFLARGSKVSIGSPIRIKRQH
jgi:uncharacterized protein